MMRSSRRRFIGDVTAMSGLVLCPQAPAGVLSWAAPEFRGSRPGEARVVEQIGLRWCPPGRFLMGSAPTEVGHRADEAQVEVTLTRGFWTATTEVTQRDWTRVVGAFPDRAPSEAFGEGDDVPLYWVDFDEAEDFCARLTRRGHQSGSLPVTWQFSLPTEAQWEYACRAGTTTATAFGDSLGRHQANFGDGPTHRGAPAPGRARPVGGYGANAWGIHDMHGNVWEWCRDWYHARLPGGRDPDMSAMQGLPNRDGTYSRVRRGGAWIEPEWACRSACRLRYEPHRRSDHIGFRVIVVERPILPVDRRG
jgi:formylglycine-generating enzyme required for sulfatase activity